MTVLLGLVYVDFSDYFVIASKDVVGRIYVKKINVSLGREYYVSISESRWKKYSEKKDFLFTQYDPKVFLKLSHDSLFVYSTVLASNVPEDFNSKYIVVEQKLSAKQLDSIRRIPHFLRADLVEFP